MRLGLVNPENLIDKPNFIVERNGESIIFNSRFYDKKALVPDDQYDIFGEINLYLQTLPEEKQEKLFNLFKEIRATFDDCWDRRDLSKGLVKLCPELVDSIDLEDLTQWVTFHSPIRIPDKLETEYISRDDRPGSREQTYLRSDYINLIVMILVIRLMAPIWSEYIIRTRTETGNNFKEYYAFHLIHRSKFFFCDALDKLRVYIELSIDPTRLRSASNQEMKRASAILDGVSTEEFPVWILSQTVVRRVALADIRGECGESVLAMSIYKYVTSKEKSSDNSFSGMVKDKRVSANPDDNNLSKLEGYKVKQDIASGDLVYLEYFMSDTEKVAYMLEPELDRNRLYAAFESVKEMHNHPISDPQIIMLQWIMKPVISPKAILHLNKNIVINSLAAAQAILEHREMYNAAALVTAVADKTEDNLRVTELSSRISMELQNRLGELYPFIKKPTTRQRAGRNHNQAIVSIDHLVDLISLTPWILTCDDTLVEKLHIANRRNYTPPRDLKNKMAELVIDLAERRAKDYHLKYNIPESTQTQTN